MTEEEKLWLIRMVRKSLTAAADRVDYCRCAPGFGLSEIYREQERKFADWQKELEAVND